MVESDCHADQALADAGGLALFFAQAAVRIRFATAIPARNRA